MKMKNSISLSFETEQPTAGSYLAVAGIFLFVSVLTVSNVQARDMYRVAPIEVVVYEGNPIDYSNQNDVIVIEEISSQNSYSNVILVQDFTDDSSSQPQEVTYQASPSSQAQSLSDARPTQQPKAQPMQVKAIPVAVQRTDSIAQNIQLQPTKALAPDAGGKDSELVAFYVDIFGKQKRSLSKRPVPSATMLVKQTSTKQVAQKKTSSDEVQLALITSKNKKSQSKINKVVPNQILITNAEGKDAELVAFYMDVFGKQKNNLSKKSSPTITLVVNKTLPKNVVQQKSKPMKAQLAKRASKGKDPELVAFYDQVFGNDISSSSKHVPTVVTLKAKDPELVAFYEREFGKSMDNSKVALIKQKASEKVKITASSKSNQKRSVKKAKEKHNNSMNTAAVELQQLIDELTSKNII